MIAQTGTVKRAEDVLMGDIIIVQGAPHRVVDEPTYVYPYGPTNPMVCLDLRPADGRGVIRGRFNLFAHIHYNVCVDTTEEQARIIGADDMAALIALGKALAGH